MPKSLKPNPFLGKILSFSNNLTWSRVIGLTGESANNRPSNLARGKERFRYILFFLILINIRSNISLKLIISGPPRLYIFPLWISSFITLATALAMSFTKTGWNLVFPEFIKGKNKI